MIVLGAALMAAIGVMIFARTFKNRDALGLAMFVFVIALACGIVVSFSVPYAVALNADQGGEALPDNVLDFTTALLTFLPAFLIGCLFMAFMKAAPRD